MTIEISENEQDQLLVYENDDPELIAYLFGQKHNLEKEEVLVIEKNIRKNIEQVLVDKS